MQYTLTTDALRAAIPRLRAGDRVCLSGTVYTARDAAHQAICLGLSQGEAPPFPLKDAVIYYAGPTPPKNGRPAGACGPTTAGRMDVFTPRLLRLGVVAMIGKGERSAAVAEAIRDTGSCYLCAPGGAGALLAGCIQRMEEIAFPHLGCESVKRLTVRDMPLIVAIDAFGGDLFETGRAAYKGRNWMAQREPTAPETQSG